MIALIPARSGSKGVRNKNLAPLGGFPLIAWSVCAGLEASAVDRVIMTTDSEEIAAVGRRFGAETPFLRPPELAGDESLDIDYVDHALDWLATNESFRPELVLQLRPTTPLRKPQHINEAVAAIRADPEATGLRSVHQLAEPPQKMLGIEDGYLAGLFPHERRPEYFNLPRQAFPPAYWPNGYVDAIRPQTIRQEGALYGPRVLAFVTAKTVEIDGPDELEYLRFALERESNPLLEHLRQHFSDA